MVLCAIASNQTEKKTEDTQTHTKEICIQRIILHVFMLRFMGLITFRTDEKKK